MGVGRVCPKEWNGVVRLENVSFRYPSRKSVSVLNGVDLEINVGDSVAIV
jgi:ABC-type bacteriocin/lantibiotic exporter with double-glycine peptidase domain